MQHTQKNNIALLYKFFETPFNEKSIDAYDNFLTEDVVLHGPTTGQEEHGLRRLKEIDKELSKTCKDIKRNIDEIFAVDDKLIVYWSIYGTDCQEQKNKSVVVSGHGIYRFRKEKICEIWQSWDKINFLEQLSQNNISLSLACPAPTSNFLKNLGIDTYHKKASLLSCRERECLKLLLQGKTAKETAAVLSLTYRTIESYFEIIKNKLDCSNKKELFALAQILEKLALL